MIVISAIELEKIRDSYIKLSKDSKNLFEDFYPNFFELDPSAKKLFEKINMKKQKRMIFDSITYFITNKEITDEDIREYGQSLKTLHESVNMTNSQVNNFRKAFLKTLEQEIGSDFSDQINQIWTKLLDKIMVYFIVTVLTITTKLN